MKKTIDIIFLLLLLLFVLLFGWQYNFKPSTELGNVVYSGVVFGAGITKSGLPSVALMYRLDKAVELYRNGRLNKIIVSGKIPETIVMKNYLLSKMVKLEDIVIDIKGINTANTIKNIKRLQENDKNFNQILFISQRYHLPRIFILAHKYGIKDFHLVATETKSVKKIENLLLNLRETLAIFKSLVFE